MRARPGWRFAVERPGPRPAAWPLTGAMACGVALGAMLEYFADPSAGRRRRHTARDRSVAVVRRTERRALRRARRAESDAAGMLRRALNARRPPKEPVDDGTLAHRVESELFRRTSVPKGQIDINVEERVVFLRGVTERPEEIARVEEAARRIPGVRSVENLLHLPGTPAPASRPRRVRKQADG